MARDESNREDLLGEATALVERIELVTATGPPIVAGFRADGALSVFIGEDPVYQFNAAGELRRAYQEGLLFKAVQGRLVSLSRKRLANEVQLVRHELTDAEQDEFLASMTQRLRELGELLAAETFDVIGQVPPDSDVLWRLQKWLKERQAWSIAQRPNA